MGKSPSAIDYLESLMVWMHERPQLYCQDAGELDQLFWYLHMVWARFVDRDLEHRRALEKAGSTPQGLFVGDERNLPVDLADQVTQKVLKFWSLVDSDLGIKERVDHWYKQEHFDQ